MSRPLRHPAPTAPRTGPRAVPDYAVASIECPQCRGTGFDDDGLIRTYCRGCDSNGRLDLRIVAATPAMHALFEDWQEVGGYFCLVDGAERMLAYARTMEDVLAGRWWFDGCEQHATVMRALGVGGGL